MLLGTATYVIFIIFQALSITSQASRLPILLYLHYRYYCNLFIHFQLCLNPAYNVEPTRDLR